MLFLALRRAGQARMVHDPAPFLDYTFISALVTTQNPIKKTMKTFSSFCRGGSEHLFRLQQRKSANTSKAPRVFYSQEISMMDGSAGSMADKHVVGFLGLGVMGKPMATNLLKKAGFQVLVWNRTSAKCDVLVHMGAKAGSTPADIVRGAPITISMLADPAAVEQVYFGAGGVMESVGEGKSIVDMSTIDADTCELIGSEIHKRGGRFLAAPVSGSKKPAEDGQLIILAGGDQSLFEDMKDAFAVIGKRAFYLGGPKQAANMKLVVNMMLGEVMASLAEALQLADKVDLKGADLLEVLDLGALASPMYRVKGPLMLQGKYAPNFPLQHQEKDLRLVCKLAAHVGQAVPLAEAAHELYKGASAKGLGELDFSAVNEVLRDRR
mmetsp:Transcript_38557/g.62472  ORF Transcript_38557/g.62472 Transcript_38557/m.62472 type:complete len:381 (-) Transcript_38557:182-1324(-)